MTTRNIKLPLEAILAKAMINNNYNQAQAITTLNNFHEKYDMKYCDDLTIFMDFERFKAYAEERSIFTYRYFNLYKPELRPYIKKIELEGLK